MKSNVIKINKKIVDRLSSTVQKIKHFCW